MSRAAPAASAGRRFHLRYTAALSAVGFAAAGLVTVSLEALLRLGPRHWVGFAWLVACFAVASTAVAQPLARRWTAPLRAWLDASPGTSPGPCLYAATALPWRTALLLVFSYAAAGLVIGAGMERLHPELRGHAFWRIAIAALCAGLAANVWVYFGIKRLCAPLVVSLAAAMPDPDERARCAARVPLARKLQLCFAAVSIATVVFAAVLAHVRAERSLETWVSSVQQGLIERHADAIEAGDARALAEALETARALGIATEIAVLDAEALATSGLAPAEVTAVAGSAATSGDGTGLFSPHLLAWRRLGDGRILLATLPGDAMAGLRGETWLMFSVLLAVSIAAALLAARLVARDVGAMSAALRTQAQRIASGDLGGGESHESEDELGELGRSFERMRGSLREM
nr:HAMP domain-containing protein [Myxococcota bacterium]